MPPDVEHGMIVRDAGSSWHVVLQTDHAELSGEIAQRWRDLGEARDSLIIAAERHDDGWAIWEKAPTVDPQLGKPLNFLDVHISLHLAFYRACIATVTDEDSYAGLLISMHGAGIYRQRYGTDLNVKMNREPEAIQQIDAFVAEQESGYPGRIAALGISEEERWRSYQLLQLFDRFSLYFCLNDLDRGETATVADYTFEPVGPRAVTVTPFPFDAPVVTLPLKRRVIPKRPWDTRTFAAEFLAIQPETVEITLSAG